MLRGQIDCIDCLKTKEIISDNKNIRICRESNDDSFKNKDQLERMKTRGDNREIRNPSFFMVHPLDENSLVSYSLSS